MTEDPIDVVLDYLKAHKLTLTTAESCTAGRMAALLSEKSGTGEVLESSFVVYSPTAKQRILGVQATTIETFGLTSEEVAHEMAAGALIDSPVKVSIATTGVAGPDAEDDIPPGTVCFAWAFAGQPIVMFTRTHRFFGDRLTVIQQAALYGLQNLPECHQRWLRGERG